MRAILITLLFFILAHAPALAQDVIHKHDGQTINAKNIVIGQADIEYVRYDDASMVVRTIPRAEVLKIKYANGTVKPISQPKKAGSVEVDKGSLWGTNTGGRQKAQGGGRPRKEAIEKPIFSVGPKLGWFSPTISSYDHYSNKIRAWGGGWRISAPLGKAVEGEVRKSVFAFDYSMTLMSGRGNGWYSGLPPLDPEANHRLTSADYGLLLFYNTLAIDYRVRLGRRAFVAPSMGLSLCVDGSDMAWESTTFYGIGDGIEGNESADYDHGYEESPPVVFGLNAGVEFIFRPVGVEFRYDTSTNGLWIGLNLAL